MNIRRVVKALLAFVVVPLFVGMVVVLVLAMTPWGNEQVRGVVVSQANNRINGTLSVGSLRGNLFSRASIGDVSLVDSAKRPVFTARRVQVDYGLLAALRGKVVIHSIVLDTPYVALDKQPGARWNFQTLARTKQKSSKSSTNKKISPELNDIVIHHGRFSYRRPWKPDTTLSAAALDSAIAKALAPTARKRTERVAGGYQRVLDYHDIDTRLASVRIGQNGGPTAVVISALAMIGEPYRPPLLNIRSLTGTLYASKDSLWWRGAKMVMPASTVSGDGTIGFRKAGFRVDLTGAPVALADLRWLNPKLAEKGGGNVRYAMHVRADTSDFAISGADLRYDDARITGDAAIARIAPEDQKSTILVRSADVSVANLSTAIIHELAPTLKLRRSGVLSGRVVANGVPKAMDVDADVSFDDVTAGRSRVVAKGGINFIDGISARELSLKILPLQMATLKSFAPAMKVDGVLNGEAVVNGSQRGGWQVQGDLTHVDRGETSRVSGTGRYQNAGKRIVADATLQPLSLVTVGRFAPNAELRGSISGKVHAEGTTRDLAFSSVLRSATGGSVDARGSIALAGARSRYNVVAALDALNGRAFSRRAPRTLLNGSVSLRGTGTRTSNANAAIGVNLTRSAYDTFSVERIFARGRTANGLLTIDSVAVDESGVRVVAAGTLGLIADRAGTVEFTVLADSIGVLRKWLGGADTGIVRVASGRQAPLLAAARADSVRRAAAMRIEQLALGLPGGVELHVDTLRGVRRDLLAGSLQASGTLRGNIKELGAAAVVNGSGLAARGYTVQRMAANLTSENVLNREMPLRFTLNADTLQASGMAFERLTVDGTWGDKKLNAALRLRQDSLVSYAASGGYSKLASGAHEVRLDSVRANFDSLVWRLSHGAKAMFGKDDITLDSLDLRSSANGRLFVNATAPKAGSVNLDVIAENVRVATVFRALQQTPKADAVLAANIRVTGTRPAPIMKGAASARSVIYGDVVAPNADVTFDYSSRRLGANITARDSTGRRVLFGSAALPLDLALESVKGDRKLAGALLADLALDSLPLAALPFSTRALDEFHGMLAGDAHVRGDWTKPIYTGRVSLRDGGLTMPASSTGMKVDRALADVRMTGDSVIIDSLVAYAGGRLKASGAIDLTNRSRPYLSLAAAGQNLRVFDSPRGFVEADADVLAAGPFDEIRVTGNGEMKRGFLALKQFRKDLLRVKPPGALSFFAIFDTSARPNDSVRVALERARHRKLAVIADLSLMIDHGNYYRNRPDANTEFFTGSNEIVRFHLDQRTHDQWIIGFTRIGDGVAYFRTRGFVPARGALTFGTYTGAPGIVQQVGERAVWEPGRGLFPLQLLTAGTSVGPAVGLESGTLFPIRGRELNGYLTMGRLGLSLLQQSGSSLSGSEAWSGQLSGETGALAHRQQAATAIGVVLHDIGTGLTKEYALDAFSVSPGDVPTELVFGKTGGVRGALVEGGRYITPDLYVAGQLRFTTGIPGIRMARKYGTDYRFDVGIEPRFLFRNPAELGITHPTDRSGAFGAFLTRMWNW